MIQCKKCQSYKEESKFWICSNNKRGYQSYCKYCVKVAKKERYIKDKVKILESNTQWREDNKEKKKEADRKYAENNRERLSKNNKIWRENNRDKIKEQRRKSYAESIENRIIISIRTRQNHVLKGKLSTTKNLGCNKYELKNYIESLFEPGMNWDNRYRKGSDIYHTWSIDHIIPLSKLSSFPESDKVKILHYTNLKPIWHYENLKKYNHVVSIE